MLYSFFFLVFALVPAAFGGTDFPAPWFYHGLDGPVYENITASLETRSYESALWASTDILTNDINEATSIGFDRLFDYISGANDQSITIDMTTPVLTKVQPGQGPNCNSTFTVSFYVPYIYQTESGPPAPTSADVYIKSIGPLTVAVSEFSGWAVQPKLIAKTDKLSKDIEKAEDLDSDPSAGDVWWFAGYDPPFRVSNRHNEVFLEVIKKI